MFYSIWHRHWILTLTSMLNLYIKRQPYRKLETTFTLLYYARQTNSACFVQNMADTRGKPPRTTHVNIHVSWHRPKAKWCLIYNLNYSNLQEFTTNLLVHLQQSNKAWTKCRPLCLSVVRHQRVFYKKKYTEVYISGNVEKCNKV